MRIGVAREVDPAERRVAATPETIKKLAAFGADLAVEPGAQGDQLFPLADKGVRVGVLGQLAGVVANGVAKERW